MIYQNILNEISPYMAGVMRSLPFGEHRHADIELQYCINDKVHLTVNKKSVTVNKGELILVSPMAAHSVVSDQDSEGKALLVVAGVSLLKNFFSHFSALKTDHLVITAETLKENRGLTEVLEETVALCEKGTDINALLIRGNIYKLCAYLIEIINSDSAAGEEQRGEMKKVANVEKALEMIYYEHNRQLTVEEVAAATGYGKSNFCKVFKAVTGDTFHNVLNRKRIQSACDLLLETDMQISEISAQVGFAETKSFCRVFKESTGKTPGQYRKSEG